MEEFRKIAEKLKVLARSRPEDKYLLVSGLRDLRCTVAVTGDGTNDAPALKKADVGFAMGITGTQVAQHACDIMIMDDNFAHIVQACMWGRNIYDNIRRFLQFQLTVNVVALVTAFAGACILKESPLQPIQLLWLNLIMDSLGSLALATEPPKEAVLDRPPHSRDEYIISRTMVKHIGIMAIYQVIIVFGIVFWGEDIIPESNVWWRFNSVPEDYDVTYSEVANPPTRPESDKVFPGRLYDWSQNDLYHAYVDQYGPSRHFTVVFTSFVMMQIFNMINCRKIHDEKNVFAGFMDNPMFLIIISIIIVVQVPITQFTADAFYVSRDGLSGIQWLISILIGASTLIIDFLIKFIPDTVCPEVS